MPGTDFNDNVELGNQLEEIRLEGLAPNETPVGSKIKTVADLEVDLKALLEKAVKTEGIGLESSDGFEKRLVDSIQEKNRIQDPPKPSPGDSWRDSAGFLWKMDQEHEFRLVSDVAWMNGLTKEQLDLLEEDPLRRDKESQLMHIYQAIINLLMAVHNLELGIPQVANAGDLDLNL